MLSTSLTRAATAVSVPAHVRSTKLHERQIMVSALIDPRPVPSTTMLSHPQENQPFSIAPSPMATSLSSDDSAFVTCSETSQRVDTQADHHHQEGQPKRCGLDSAQSSLPNSSQPTLSDQTITMPPPPVPRRVAHSDTMIQGPSGTVNTGDDKSHLLASLSKHPSLYELSRTDLETLVSQVIREEGFLHLVRENASWPYYSRYHSLA